MPVASDSSPQGVPTPEDRARVLAVDIGATKMAVGVVDETGGVLRRWQAPTGADRPDAEEIFATLARLVVVALESDSGREVRAVGVGAAGPMSGVNEFVSPLNVPAWRGFPLRRRLAELTGLEVVVDGDAKALAVGEGWVGAAQGRSNYLAMVVSTGVGGGIVLDGRLVDGRLGNAGHIGHVIVVDDGAPCACGGRGCLEAEASGGALERRLGRPARDADGATVRRTGRLVGRAVASVVNLLDLDLALVAGSVALGFGGPFFAAAQEELDRHCRMSYARGARIRPGGLGPDGPLVGAAALAFRRARAVVDARVADESVEGGSGTEP
jgi:glucokinase